MYDRKLKFREIVDTLKMSEDSVFTILHESLGMHELFSKWVPRLLTPDQKQQRVEVSERCLELFKRAKMDFLRRYVRMDKTWMHLYTTETKRTSAEWTAAGESRPKRPKTQQWAGKVMASVFCDAHGILLRRNQVKTASHAKEKSEVPPRQCIVIQVHENDGHIEGIKLRIASSLTVFSRSGPQRLLSLC